MADYYEIVTADNTHYTADETQWPTADGGLLYNLVWVIEPVGQIVTADTTNYSADNTNWPTADGGILDGAQDYFDAEVVSEALPGEPGGGIPPLLLRPRPVVGYGYGVLPQLEGEGRGVVTVAGAGAGELPRLGGSAEGSVGVAGRSAAQLVLLRAAAIGDCGQVGRADAVFKGLAASSRGTAAVRGAGAGVIKTFEGAAIGRHDDDEAAVMAFLLAA